MAIKRIAIASIVALASLQPTGTAPASPIIPAQTGYDGHSASAVAGSILRVSEDWGSSRRHHRHQAAKYRDWYYGPLRGGFRESGPPYSTCFMKCINSSHPVDFCKNVARDHFCY